MCGFFVVFQKRSPIDESRFRLALNKIKHRGPDHTGVVFETSEGAIHAGSDTVYMGFGHHRLSILDLDERSNQPFKRHGRTLVYNGEIYNYRQLKQDFGGATTFSTQGDTELLFEQLSQYGIAGLEHANGMWAFSYFDPAQGTVIAARDRYGKKPLFFYHDATSFCLSSTIGAILEYKQLAAQVKLDHIDAFLMEGMLMPRADEQTYLMGIQQVPTGTSLRFNIETWTKEIMGERSLQLTSQCDLPDDELTLKELLEDAVLARLVSDRNIGLLLSGGIDSSLILSVLYAAKLHENVHCFIGDTGTSDDADYAQQCADQLGIKTETIRLDYGAGTFERFLKMCAHQEKPFPLNGNSMAMSEMYSRISEQGMAVVIDGTGGDEIFGGYWDRYYAAAVDEATKLHDCEWLLESEQTPYIDYSYNSADVIRQRQNGSDTKISLASCRAALSIAKFCRPSMLETKAFDPISDFKGSFTDLLIEDASKGRLSEWIWQNDRNSMMASMESRSPLLDYRLFRFVKSGYRQKFKQQFNKYELRKMFDAFQPLPTQWRVQKQGFRWVAGEFFDQNSSEILALIDGSQILRARLDIDSFLDEANRNETCLKSQATAKMLCVAGLEEQMGLTV